jgi:hypothetical protein
LLLALFWGRRWEGIGWQLTLLAHVGRVLACPLVNHWELFLSLWLLLPWLFLSIFLIPLFLSKLRFIHLGLLFCNFGLFFGCKSIYEFFLSFVFGFNLFFFFLLLNFPNLFFS